MTYGRLVVIGILGLVVTATAYPGNTQTPKQAAEDVSVSSCPGNKALVVGVEEYANPTQNLQGVGADVRLLTEALVSTGTFSRQQIRTLANQQAAKANILNACQDWLIDGTRAGDTVVFYFNGISGEVWDQEELHAGLIPWDGGVTQELERRTLKGRLRAAYPLHATANWILDNEIIEISRRLGGRNAIFILDADIGSLSDLRRRIEAAVTKSLRRKPRISANEKGPRGGLAVFVGGDNGPTEMQLFQEPPEGLHSVFTWFLVNGLSGKAALKDGGRITLGELARFVEEGVKKKGFSQTPQHLFIPQSFGKFTLTGAHSPAVKRKK